MKNIVFGILTVVFFVVYWNLFRWIWHLWVPANPITEIIAMFTTVFINIPLSVISTQRVIKIIKEN